MPKSLDYFNGEIDPLLPSTIKPALYAYDDYQTYDLVYAERIAGKLASIFLPPDFFIQYLDDTVAVLFERYAPVNYPWAEDYSQLAYEFLSIFSGTDYYNFDEFTGKAFPLVKNSLDFGSEAGTVVLSDYPEYLSFVFTVPATENREEIVLTWLDKDWEQETDGMISQRAFTRRYKIIPTYSHEYSVQIFTAPQLPCSVVVSATDTELVAPIKAALNNISKNILYDNLPDYLTKVKNQILAMFPRLFKTIDKLYYEGTLSWTFRKTVSGNTTSFGSPQTDFTYSFTHADFCDRPNYYRAAFLRAANNNYWQNSADGIDQLPKAVNFYGSGQSYCWFTAFKKSDRSNQFTDKYIDHWSIAEKPIVNSNTHVYSGQYKVAFPNQLPYPSRTYQNYTLPVDPQPDGTVYPAYITGIWYAPGRASYYSIAIDQWQGIPGLSPGIAGQKFFWAWIKTTAVLHPGNPLNSTWDCVWNKVIHQAEWSSLIFSEPQVSGLITTYNETPIYSATNVDSFTGYPDGTFDLSSQETISGFLDYLYYEDYDGFPEDETNKRTAQNFIDYIDDSFYYAQDS